MSGAIPEPVEIDTPRGVARYYVFRVYTLHRNLDPEFVSIVAGPFVDFTTAWYSAGAIRRIYQNQIYIAGEFLNGCRA